MRVVNLVAAEEVLGTLNTPPVAPDAQEAYIRAMERTGAPGPEWDSYLAAVLGARLRGLVDQWLVTGERKDHSEAPLSRNLAHTKTARFDVIFYMDRYPAAVVLTPDGSDLSVSIADITALPRQSSNPYFDLSLEGTRLFVGVMASEWKWRLCKCVHCGKYFLHPRPRKVYRKGTFCCRQHQSHGAAVASTKARRELVKSTLIELAAEQLLKLKVTDPAWQGNASIKVRVARQISRHRKAYAQVVESHWVTRNRLEIERKRTEFARRDETLLDPSRLSN
jgi:hypothetical protein